MNFAGAQRVTIRRVTTVDEGMGKTSETVTTRSWQAMVAPRVSGESTDSESPAIVDGRTLYGPATVTLDADDRIVIGDVEYEVDGIPAAWPWPGGGMAGLEVQLKRAASPSGA